MTPRVRDNTTSATATATTTAPSSSKTIRIAVSTWYLNAGECTRAVEIAKAIRELSKREGLDVEMRFFSTSWSNDKGMSYEHFVSEAGFPLTRIGPETPHDLWREMIQNEHKSTEFATEKMVLPMSIIYREVAAVITKYNPTIILHGFLDGLPMKVTGLPTVAYVPLPFTRDFVFEKVFDDIPEQLQQYGLSYIPKFIRRTLLLAIMSNPNLPTFAAQPSLRKAAVMAGWKKPKKVEGEMMLFDMVDADLLLINDLKGNYVDQTFDDHIAVTGPVFPHDDLDFARVKATLDPEILRVFGDDDDDEEEEDNASTNRKKKKVFVSMGSSGHKEHLVVAIKALLGAGSEYNVVAIVPPTICPLEDFKAELGIYSLPDNVYLTDQFLPNKVVNCMADVAIIHGGQGTVQTAMGAGTPIVGISLQPEQRFNLQQISQRGAGIRVSNLVWNPKVVAEAVHRVFTESSFRSAAKAVQAEMEASDGKSESAKLVLEFAQKAAAAE